MVLEGATLTDAHASAQFVRRTIEDSPIDTLGAPIRITVSIGVSGFEGEVEGIPASVQSLLKQANTNLFASILGGRNRVTLSDSIDTGVMTSSSRQRVESSILSPAGAPNPSRHIRH